MGRGWDVEAGAGVVVGAVSGGVDMTKKAWGRVAASTWRRRSGPGAALGRGPAAALEVAGNFGSLTASFWIRARLRKNFGAPRVICQWRICAGGPL